MNIRLPVKIGALAIGMLFPWITGIYEIKMAQLVFNTVTLAVGLDICMGFTGQISFAQAAFHGLGAYATLILMAKAGFPFWMALPAAAIITSLLSILIGIPALRMKSHYLALGTAGFAVISFMVFQYWTKLTNGPMGMVPPELKWGGIHINDPHLFYYIHGLITALLVFFAWNITHSKIGRAFIAIRGSEVASDCLGIHITKYKVLAFCMSAFYAGVAGGLYPFFIGFIDPPTFSVWFNVLYVIMIVVGGLGSIPGAIIGASILVILPEVLSFLVHFKELVYAVLLILSLRFMPRGIVGIYGTVAHRLWLRKHSLKNKAGNHV